MPTLKQSYDQLKKRYDDLTFQLAGLLAKRKMAEEQLIKLKDEVVSLIGEKNSEEVLAALKKEVETRFELLQQDIRSMEQVLAEFKTVVDKNKKDDSDDLLRGL